MRTHLLIRRVSMSQSDSYLLVGCGVRIPVEVKSSKDSVADVSKGEPLTCPTCRLIHEARS